MTNWKEHLRVLESHTGSDKPAILRSIVQITSCIETIRTESSSETIDWIVRMLMLLVKNHPNVAVKRSALCCLQKHFVAEKQLIEQQIVALKVLQK